MLSGNALYGTAAGEVYGVGGRSSPDLSGALFKLNTDGTGFTNFYVFSPVAGAPNNETSPDERGCVPRSSDCSSLIFRP